MRHTKSEARVQLLHPKIREKVREAIIAAEAKLPTNIAINIVQGLRTIEEQNALYAQGRTTPGPIVTKAKGGSSYHNYGLAIDFCLMIDGKVSWNVDKNWLIVVATFKELGFAWGGDWKTLVDKPHFEMTFGNNWRTLYKKYVDKDFIPNTKYVNI